MLQRAAAMVLCACLMVPLCRPLFSLDPEAALPPCCRRNGKHRCAMLAHHLALQQRQASEPRFSSAPDPCPYRSLLFAPKAPQPLGSPQSLGFCTEVEIDPAIRIYIEVITRVSQSRNHFQRGPPTLL